MSPIFPVLTLEDAVDGLLVIEPPDMAALTSLDHPLGWSSANCDRLGKLGTGERGHHFAGSACLPDAGRFSRRHHEGHKMLKDLTLFGRVSSHR